MLNNNPWEHVEFTQSARRHKVGRGRVIEVLTDPVVLERVEDEGSLPIRWLVLGTDRGGRAIELIVLEERTKVVVIHAMDLRKKYRARYERGLTLGGKTLEDKS